MVRDDGREPGVGTQSVERALGLLTQFTEEHPQRRISELVARTGLGQSTVSRLVGALVGLGFLSHDERSGLYSVGSRVVTLAGIGLNQSQVHQQARQPTQNLAARLGLGANVAERHDDQLFYLCHFEGVAQPKSVTMIGSGGPLYATALGKALLSELPDKDVAELLGATFPAYTPRTIVDLDTLVATLAEARRRGYATEVEELAFARACLAAPIRDRSGTVVAALSVSGPLSAMDLETRQDELAMMVIECADQISTALGYHAAAMLRR